MHKSLIRIIAIIALYLTSLGMIWPNSAFALSLALPSSREDVLGQMEIIEANSRDTLDKIGRRYGIGIHEMKQANPMIKKTPY